MKIKGIDHLNMYVTNLELSTAWYRNLFCFEVVEEGKIDNRPWCILQSGDAQLCLYEKVDSAPYDYEHDALAKVNTINHFGFRIESEHEWEATIRKFEPEVLYDGIAIKYPHSKSWYLRDPNGYNIEVSKWENNEVVFT